MPIAPRVPFAWILVAYATIGISESAVGAVWPRLSGELALDAAGQALLTVPFACGFMAAALPHGRVLARLHSGEVLLGGAGAGVVGAAVVGMARVPALVAVGSLLLGFAAGSVDAALANHGSAHFSPRRLQFMYTGFGFGAFAAQLGVTAILAAGGSWRWLYAGLLVIELALVGAWLGLRSRWAPPPGRGAVAASSPDATGDADAGAVVATLDRSTRTRVRVADPIVALSLAGFFIYAGTEVGIGAWAKTLLQERGAAEGVAGLASSAFFGSLMLGRLVLGVRAVDPARLVTAMLPLALGATVVFGVIGTASVPVGLVALPVIGLCFAGVFPALVALTPGRVGADRAPTVMGWQVGVASAGTAVVPATVGLIASVVGTGAAGPTLVVAAVLLLGTTLATSRVARRQAASSDPSSTTVP